MKWHILLLVFITSFATTAHGQTFSPRGAQDLSVQLINECRANYNTEEFETIMHGGYSTSKEKACALRQISLQRKDLKPKYENDAILALKDSDPLLQVAAIEFVGDTYAPVKKSTTALRELLEEATLPVMKKLIDALLLMSEPLNSEESYALAKFLNSTELEDPVVKVRAALLLAGYGTKPYNEEGVLSFTNVIADVAKAAAEPDPDKNPLIRRYAIGIGGNLYKLKVDADKLKSSAPEYVKLLRSNLSSRDRTNFVVDLGYMPSALPETKEVLCEQLHLGDSSLAQFTLSTLIKLGVKQSECTKNSPAPPIFLDRTATTFNLARNTKDSDFKELEMKNFKEVPCVDFYKKPLGNDCIPKVKIQISQNSLLRINYTCPAQRQGYVGWSCSSCKDDSELRSGISGEFPHTPQYHYIHASVKGTYRINFTCSPPGTAGGFGGVNFSVNVP